MINKTPRKVLLKKIIKLIKGKPPIAQYYYGKDADIYLNPEYLRGRSTAIFVKPSSTAVKTSGGDIIILWDGSNAGEIFISKKGIVSSTMCLVTHSDSYRKGFLYYSLKYHEPFLRGQTSGSGIPHVDNEVLANIEISQFAGSEQSKIAEILETVDRAIEQTEAIIAKQQRIKTGLMQDLLTKGIDAQGNIRSEETHEFKDSLLGRIPVEWDVCLLEDYMAANGGIKPGPFGSSLTKDIYVENGYRVYGQEQVIGGTLEIGDYYIDDYKYAAMETFSVKAGDVLISLVGTIGHVIIVPDEFHPGIINPRILRFRPNRKKCISDFLKIILLSEGIKKQISNMVTGGTMQVLSGGIIRKLLIHKISVSEQFRIVHVINSMNISLDKTVEDLNKLKHIKTALMQDLLTGKKRVTPLLKETEVKNDENG